MAVSSAGGEDKGEGERKTQIVFITDRPSQTEEREDLVCALELNPFENLIRGKRPQQLRNRFPLPRQNQIRRDLTQRL